MVILVIAAVASGLLIMRTLPTTADRASTLRPRSYPFEEERLPDHAAGTASGGAPHSRDDPSSPAASYQAGALSSARPLPPLLFPLFAAQRSGVQLPA